MKKRLCSLLLVLSLLAAALCVPAAAATGTSGSMSNFAEVAVYEDQFDDVSQEDWYYENVAALYDLGLTDGDGQGGYSPNDPVTVAEALTFAARIHSIYYYGDASTGPSQYEKESDTLWYNSYVRYLYSAGLFRSEFSQQYTSEATRAQVAHILANILPASELTEINNEAVDMALSSSRLMTDVTEDLTYYDDIVQLYRWGVVGGSDSYGSFYPDETITRAELAAMLTRLVGAAERLTLEWSYADAVSAEGTTYASLVTGESKLYSAPTTEAGIESDIWYMISNDMTSITLNYGVGGLTNDQAAEIAQTFLDILIEHPELMYNQVSSTTIASKGLLTITFGSTCIENAAVLSGRRQYALDKAIAVHDQLWADGTLTADMTELEKARVYFTWICENCEYDYSIQTLSHTSYSVFAGGIAVCDGYTGAYNLLLRLEGIDCTSATIGTGDNKHMWTVATLDGVTYHIDATWGDSDDTPNYQYFAMTPEESMQIHNLNAAYSGTQLPG